MRRRATCALLTQSSNGAQTCHGVKSLGKLVDIYFSTVGQNCVLQLNVPPTKEGLLHELDVRQMRLLGNYIRALHASDAVTSTES